MINSIISFLKRKILRDPRGRWNYQYAKGQWEGLKDPIEFERQEVCKLFFEKYKSGGSVVEIGCGEGMFVEFILQQQGYSDYCGVDVSDLAIQNAQKLADNKTKFIIADMDNLDLGKRYDVILYNESINYSKNIERVLKNNIQNLLNPNGIFIISVHNYKHSDEHWSDIHKVLKTIDKKTVKNARSEWNIEVLTPPQYFA